jgi:hypothetical protein
VANCFATDRSKAVTPQVLTFFVCGVYFETDYYKTMLSSPQYLLAVWEALSTTKQQSISARLSSRNMNIPKRKTMH